MILSRQSGHYEDICVTSKTLIYTMYIYYLSLMTVESSKSLMISYGSNKDYNGELCHIRNGYPLDILGHYR